VAEQQQPRHVLVADQERLMRWYLAQVAEDSGCLTTEAHSLEMALALARDSVGPIDVMFLSCPQPFADLALVAAIRQFRPLCRVVVMTNFASEAFAAQAAALGVERVIVKPIEHEEVRTLVQAAPPMTAHPVEHRSKPFRFQLPQALKRERDSMYAQLARAGDEPGRVGSTAKQAERLLNAQSIYQERFVLPPLGLLPLLAAGVVWPEMHPAIAMAADLKSDLPRLLEDHAAIVAALRVLEDTALGAGRSDLALLAQKLIAHAETEAEILYPAAILTGRFLEIQLARRPGGPA
jgi:ActR/RegA family two-component response regulator